MSLLICFILLAINILLTIYQIYQFDCAIVLEYTLLPLKTEQEFASSPTMSILGIFVLGSFLLIKFLLYSPKQTYKAPTQEDFYKALLKTVELPW